MEGGEKADQLGMVSPKKGQSGGSPGFSLTSHIPDRVLQKLAPKKCQQGHTGRSQKS